MVVGINGFGVLARRESEVEDVDDADMLEALKEKLAAPASLFGHKLQV
jgi:hypothetical protein